ncbi:phosphatidylinositol 4-kinase gamma 4-like [Phragmites australis]|uniref:phosphatidylinositol 4-kinase gamma 4-like n=1 Tax=Phragmites australis TaxID=29695 RepID=UPI002D78FD1E|nr:phosphatidylinositol 4-kinase gamma 4-like [Phragmites australis]XP_062228881.1 phosphatidylinositol 4-kinase gamma 4-like [Phragmites australis]
MSSAGVIALGPVPEDFALLPICFDGSRSPHCLSGSQLQDSILIFLAVPGAPLMPMSVLGSESVASVKLRIQRFKGFVVTKQRLVLDGHELARNNCPVKDYGLAEGNVLHLVIRLSDLRVINIETATGKKFQFQVDQSRSVKFLKTKLSAEGDEDIDNLEDHKLEYDGKELEDHQLIADISKRDDAVIHLFIRKPAKVRTQQVGRDTLVTIVNPEEKANLQTEAHAVNPAKSASVKPALVEPIVVNPKVKLSPEVMKMISSTIAGLENGHLPMMSAEGSGGVYFMQDATGHKNVAVFKPIDEEPMAENNPRGLPLSTDGEGMKRGTIVGQGALREVAAYILDHPVGDRKSGHSVGFSGVPPTALVRSLHRGKSFKVGSLQMFMGNNGSTEDMGPRAFPVKEVHKIAVLDIRLANADRHAGNILVCKEGEDGSYKLIPIDHGYCLPVKFEDCTFEWLYWPQAREPFSDETIAYIKSLNAEEDIKLLKFHGWELSPRCAHVLRISTMLLKKGADRGLTPYDIGRILCRETVNRGSEIEDIIQEAEDAVLPGTSENMFLETVSEIIDRHLDKEFV